jgi:hypothetical protein
LEETGRNEMTHPPAATRFDSAVEAQNAGPWRVVQQMPDGRWINAGQMTKQDILELAGHYKVANPSSRPLE